MIKGVEKMAENMIRYITKKSRYEKSIGTEKHLEKSGSWAIANDIITSDNVIHRVIIADNFSTWMNAQKYLDTKVIKMFGKYRVIWIDYKHPVGSDVKCL